MNRQNLADRLLTSLLLYDKVHHFPIEVQKKIMNEPGLLLQYTSQLYTNNITV